MYKIEYLPCALQDMTDIVRYIAVDLSNATAAQKLSDEFISATDNLQIMPYINPAYHPIKPLTHEYRKLLVKNYLVFYWIEETPVKKVTIARVLYAKSDYEKNI